MEYASPFVQLLGVVSSLIVCGLCIFASCLLLREKKSGPWLMLAGSVLAFIGTAVPQGLYALENFTATYSGAIHEQDTFVVLESLMYYTVWNWLSTGSWLLFGVGLLWFSLARRGQSRRIAELESILAAASIRSAASAPPPAISPPDNEIHH